MSAQSENAEAEREEELSLHGRRLARLGGLIGGFAHEIKNPLSTIGLNLKLMEEELREPQTAREKRMLERTQRLSKEVDRLEGILDDFLNYVRAPRPRRQSISLNEVVRELTDLVGPGLEKDGIRLHAYLQEGLPRLRADAGLLHQALLNLVTNAHQALENSGRKGEILIGTGQERGSPGYHTLSVIDSGPGMSEEIRRRCFQPYFSTKRGGTGLGLAITRRFIEDHGGDIRVESEPGAGTRFYLRLPSKPPVEEGDGTDGDRATRAGGMDREAEH
ncbi:MAG: PAS domain-containing sensor histidine kinase [Planctomycetota bacterium]